MHSLTGYPVKVARISLRGSFFMFIFSFFSSQPVKNTEP